MTNQHSPNQTNNYDEPLISGNDLSNNNFKKTNKKKLFIIITLIVVVIFLIVGLSAYFYFQRVNRPIGDSELIFKTLPNGTNCIMPQENLIQRCDSVGGVILRQLSYPSYIRKELDRPIADSPSFALTCYQENVPENAWVPCNNDAECKNGCLIDTAASIDSENPNQGVCRPFFIYPGNGDYWNSPPFCDELISSYEKTCEYLYEESYSGNECWKRLAINLLDDKYCSNIAYKNQQGGCSIEVAIKTAENDPDKSYSICETLTDSSDHASCLTKVGQRLDVNWHDDTNKIYDICQKTSDSFVKDLCFDSLAYTATFQLEDLETGNMICQMISDPELQGNCLSKISLELLSTDNRESLTVCHKIIDKDIKDECIKSFAIKTAPANKVEGLNLCDTISNPEIKSFCVIEIAGRIEGINLEQILNLCDRISGSMSKDLCLINMPKYSVVINADLSYKLCQEISDSSIKDECISTRADHVGVGNTEEGANLCQEISDTTIKDACLESVASHAIMYPENGYALCQEVTNPVGYCKIQLALKKREGLTSTKTGSCTEIGTYNICQCLLQAFNYSDKICEGFQGGYLNWCQQCLKPAEDRHELLWDLTPFEKLLPPTDDILF